MTRVGYWYATGPYDRQFVADDPAFTIYRVVSDEADAPNCVTVESSGGQRFPVHVSLIDDIAMPGSPT